jgi:hypothetical protein
MATEPSKSASTFDSSKLSAEVQKRVEDSRNQRLKTRRAVAMHDPLSAEDDPDRLSAFINKRLKPPSPDSGAEAIQGETIDYIDAGQCHGNSDSSAVRRRLASSDETDIV